MFTVNGFTVYLAMSVTKSSLNLFAYISFVLWLRKKTKKLKTLLLFVTENRLL